MNKEFVPYEIALAMKEIGFDEPCIGCYIDEETKHEVSFSFDSFECEQFIEDNNLKKNSNYKTSVTAPLYQQAFRWFFDKYHWSTFNYQMSFGGEINYGFYVRTINGTDLAHAAQDSVDKAKLECLEKMIELAIKYEKENNNYE